MHSYAIRAVFVEDEVGCFSEETKAPFIRLYRSCALSHLATTTTSSWVKLKLGLGSLGGLLYKSYSTSHMRAFLDSRSQAIDSVVTVSVCPPW